MATLCLAATALSLLARYWWLADLIANLRVQLIIGLIFSLVCIICVRQKRLAVCVMLALIWHCSWITPYLFAPQKPNGVRSLKICTVNVLTQNSQHDKVLTVLKTADPDVIAVLELGTALESRFIEELSDLYPYRITQPSDGGNFGIGLWSKIPLQDETIFNLTVPLVSSISATVSWEGQVVRLFATHPIPPINARYFQARNRHLELLADRIRKQSEPTGEASTVVVGDLNLTPWSAMCACPMALGSGCLNCKSQTHQKYRLGFSSLHLPPLIRRLPCCNWVLATMSRNHLTSPHLSTS